MVDVLLRIRTLNTMVYRVIRAKRDNDVCGADEYFDAVVGHCSLCSDICLPQRMTMNVCAVSCPGFHRRMSVTGRQQFQGQTQQQQQQLSEEIGSQASALPDLNIVIPVIVLFAVILVTSVVLSIFFYRRHRRSFCTKSSTDECRPTEMDMKRGGSALESGEKATEMERLNGDIERGLPRSLSDRPLNAEEALSSLCSADINPNELNLSHQKQPNTHLQQTSIMTIV